MPFFALIVAPLIPVSSPICIIVFADKDDMIVG